MKSHVSTLLEIAICVIKDVMAQCAVSESADRDILTMVSRVKHEGLSFLTITLPTLGADFERSLHSGVVDPKYFPSFRKYRRIPAFLQGIFGLVFDADTGRIKNEPPIEAVSGIRQIAYCFKKLKLACDPKRVRKTFQGYVSDELDLSEATAPEDVDYFIDVSSVVWDWLCRAPLEPYTLVPKHGPGATAERISGNQKYVFRNWHDRLEPYFPLDSNAFANVNALDSEEFKNVSIVSEEQELPVRVITVPKTLKAPRIIAIEPVCMQYTQQALSQGLVKVLESFRMTRGHVNFTDQSINQRLAINSSQTGQMATLDLSSASDRVPRDLVYEMLNSNPDFRDAVFAARSTRAQLPSGDVLTLRKFASMGSALCFPIESMYFYTICIGALLKKRNLPVTSRNAFKVSREVYIYGDDIVVPANDAAFVINFLQKYHCRVNMSKSFWTGKFRESCGMDAFEGKPVTPVYLREMPPNDKRDASALISWVKSANLLREKGLSLTSEYLFGYSERILGKLPVLGDQAAGLGRGTFGSSYSAERWNSELQVPEVKAFVASPVYRNDKLEGFPALLKCLLGLEQRKFSSSVATSDVKHLDRTVRHGAVTLKRRWIRPY